MNDMDFFGLMRLYFLAFVSRSVGRRISRTRWIRSSLVHSSLITTLRRFRNCYLLFMTWIIPHRKSPMTTF